MKRKLLAAVTLAAAFVPIGSAQAQPYLPECFYFQRGDWVLERNMGCGREIYRPQMGGEVRDRPTPSQPNVPTPSGTPNDPPGTEPPR